MKSIIIAGLALAAAAPAAAAVTTYTDRAAFLGALAGSASYGVLTPGEYGPIAGPYEVGPFTISSSGGQNINNDGGYLDGNYLNNNNWSAQNVTVSIAVDGSYSAVGFNISGFFYSGNVDVTINGVGGYAFNAISAPVSGFFGATADGPITSMSFSAPWGELDMLYFWAGDIAAQESPSVPEPASWAMMLIGFGAAGIALRRRPRTSVRFS